MKLRKFLPLIFPFSPFLGCALATLLTLSSLIARAADPVIETFQKALFEEEANQNYEAAVTAYKEVVGKLDDQRKLAATALFRLGECYRKLGRTNEAALQYQRVMREYPDQSKLVDLSRTQVRSDASTSPASERVLMLQRQLIDQESEQLRFETLLTQLKKLSRAELIKAIPTATPDPALDKLLENRREVEQKIATLSNSRTAEHPEVKAAANLAAVLARQIDERIDGILVGIETRLLASQAQILRVRQQLAEAQRAGLATQKSSGPASESSPPSFANRSQGVEDRAEGALVSDEEEKEIRRIRALIQDSPDLINARNNPGLAPLHSAASAGYARVVRFLLESGADPNLKAGGLSSGQTALHFAARNGHKSVVDLLLDAKADPTARDSGGNTPLHLAAMQGYRLIVERLLGAGVPVNGRNSAGMTPVHYAVTAGHQSIVELLFKKGADLNVPATSSINIFAVSISEGFTPIHTAIAADQIALVRWLNTNGANVNAGAGRDRITPLHLAARNNNADAIRALICAGLELDAGDANGQTPLLYAVGGGKLAAAEVLLKAGANPNGRPILHSPLFHTVRENEEMLRLLLSYKPKLEVTNADGRTFLLWLIEQVPNCTNLVSLLLDAGANANGGLPSGYSPLHAAATRASPEITAMLLSHGADVNAMTSDGITPLFNARNSGSSWRTPERVDHTLALLLAAGADETLQRRRSISVSRRTRGYETSVFTKGTNDFNRHSLFELVATFFQHNNYGRQPALPFPDLQHVVVNRALGGGRTAETNLDVEARLGLADCSGDFWLEWGDVVEIPELDHPLPASWNGFELDLARKLGDCVSRKVNIVIKGRTNNYQLRAQIINNLFSLPSFRLQTVLSSGGLLLTSSDTSRVSVSRRDPITHEPRQWTLDTLRLSGLNDLWLRDGDVIEVPDLPPGARLPGAPAATPVIMINASPPAFPAASQILPPRPIQSPPQP